MKRIFFAVDCQNDFMNEDGALYVPNAESIKENLKKLTEYARKKEIRVIASMDKHFGTEEYKKEEGELKRWGGPFPDHCMASTKGQEQIPEARAEDPVVVPNSSEFVVSHLMDQAEIILEKQSYDVFTNPHTKEALKDINNVIVYG